MVILPVHQGTPAWHAARAKYYRTSSRAPIVMGASLYGTTRNDLMAEIKNGIVKDIDANTQALFEAGHAAEKMARKIVEGYLKSPLLPLTCLTDDKYLLASFDGIAETIRVGWEHKLWNEKLAAQIRAKELDPFYYWQLEQLALVGSLDYIIFMCSDGTKERAAFLKYVPVPGRAEALLAGWRQFDADMANYQYVEVIPVVTAAPVMALPALSIQVNGAITLTDNLVVFGEKLTAFIERLPKAPATDQEFADAEQAIKTLETAQTALEAAESSALAQVASVDEMRRTVALYVDQARSTRLMLEKLVKARKEQIRVEIVQEARYALTQHCAVLNKRLGKPCLPVVPEDFAGVIKGKKTLASLRDACDAELAKRKIEANEIADRIQVNIATLQEAGHQFLFADTAQIILKAPDDLAALVKVRIAEHAAAEQKRLDAERERIRQEESAKVQAEQERLTREAQEREEAKARADREAQEAEDKRINAELAAEEKRLQDERDRTIAAQREADRKQQALLDIDDALKVIRKRIHDLKPYTAIAKAIDGYFAKPQKKAA